MNTRITATAGGVVAMVGEVLAFAESVDLGAYLGGASIALVTIAGSVATAYGILVQARIKANKAIEEANKGSLTEQVAMLSAQIEESHRNQAKMRASLHEIRNQTAEEREKHAEEAERLIKQIELLHETVDLQRDEIAALRQQVDRLNARIAELSQAAGVPPTTPTGPALPAVPRVAPAPTPFLDPDRRD